VLVVKKFSLSLSLSAGALTDFYITLRIVACKKTASLFYVKSQAQVHYVATIVHFLMLAGFSTCIDGALHPTRYAFLHLRNDCPPAFCAKDEGFACELCGHYGFIRSSVVRDSSHSQRNSVDLFPLAAAKSLPLARRFAVRKIDSR